MISSAKLVQGESKCKSCLHEFAVCRAAAFGVDKQNSGFGDAEHEIALPGGRLVWQLRSHQLFFIVSVCAVVVWT